MDINSAMRIGLLNPDKFIREHDVKFVDDIHVFQSGGDEPSDEGLLSPIIFGDTLKERRKKLGAIKLDGYYIHPLIYSRVFKRHWRQIDGLISGETEFKINSEGNLVEVEEGEGQTGLEFFYQNFNKINLDNLEIKDNDSYILKQLKESIHNLDRNKLFINKWLIIPLMFRDVHEAEGGHVSLDIINEKYKKLLSYIKVIENGKDNPLFDLNQMRYRVQIQITEIFKFLLDKSLKGKDSVAKRQVQSKKIDYASRLVMSAPSFNNEVIGESPIDIDTIGLPLSAVCDMYAPFVINGMYNILETKFNRGEIKGTKEEFDDMYNKQELHEIINTYTSSWGERLNYLPQPNNEDEHIMLSALEENGSEWTELNRPMTITDLLYQSAYMTVELGDKYDILTRYPVMDVFNVLPNKVHVLSTEDTKKIKIEDFEYKYYPDLDNVLSDPDLMEDVDRFEKKISSMYSETANISNALLEGLNGDYLCKVA